MTSNQPERPSANRDSDDTKKREESINFRSRPAQPKPGQGADFLNYAKENTKDTVAYVLLIVGLLLMFFENVFMYGSFIVGVVFGVYFVQELSYIVTNAQRLIEEYGLVKSLIFGGTVMALFIAAPFLFIGVAIVVGLRIILLPDAK